MSLWDKVGSTDNRRVAIPATIGVAAEQPVKGLEASAALFQRTVLTATPGANTSRADPVPEKEALTSSRSLAPTEMVRGEAPGKEMSASPKPPLPAHAMRIEPAFRAF